MPLVIVCKEGKFKRGFSLLYDVSECKHCVFSDKIPIPYVCVELIKRGQKLLRRVAPLHALLPFTSKVQCK